MNAGPNSSGLLLALQVVNGGPSSSGPLLTLQVVNGGPGSSGPLLTLSGAGEVAVATGRLSSMTRFTERLCGGSSCDGRAARDTTTELSRRKRNAW